MISDSICLGFVEICSSWLDGRLVSRDQIKKFLFQAFSSIFESNVVMAEEAIKWLA